MDLKISYPIIMGSLFLRKIRAVENIHYLKLKFRAGEGIGIMQKDRKVAQICFVVSSRRAYYITMGHITVEDKENAEK